MSVCAKAKAPAPAPAPRARPFNALRSLVQAVRAPFSPKSSSRPSPSSASAKQFFGRPISSPHPDEDTRAIGSRLGVDLNTATATAAATAQRDTKARSTPCLPTLPSSPLSFSTLVSTSGSSTPFDAASDSSVSIYSQSLSTPKLQLQPRPDYHKLPPSNTPVSETRTPPRPAPPYSPTRPPRVPGPVPPVLAQVQVQVQQQVQVQPPSHPCAIPCASPKPPSYSRPTPAAYPDLATPRTRHRSLPSLDRPAGSPKPAPPPGTPLPPLPNLPKTVPPRPRRNAARPSTAGDDRRPPLRATASTDGDIFTLRQGATAATSATLRLRRTRHHASSSTLYF